MYVHTGANRSAWVEHIEADPKVRLRVSDSVYDLAASRVDGQDEFGRSCSEPLEAVRARRRVDPPEQAHPRTQGLLIPAVA